MRFLRFANRGIKVAAHLNLEDFLRNTRHGSPPRDVETFTINLAFGFGSDSAVRSKNAEQQEGTLFVRAGRNVVRIGYSIHSRPDRNSGFGVNTLAGLAILVNERNYIEREPTRIQNFPYLNFINAKRSIPPEFVAYYTGAEDS